MTVDDPVEEPTDPPEEADTPGAAEPAGEARRGWRRLRLSRDDVPLALCYVVALLIDVLVTAVRWHAVNGARFAGHADPSWYYQSARNLATGRGFTVDFVWHFLLLPPHLHHYAPDYWQPLPSILMAGTMKAYGRYDVATAVRAPLLAAALVPFAAAWLARSLRTDRYVAPFAMVLVALAPGLTFWSVQAESVPFFVLFVLVALALACGRGDGIARWAFAGVAAAAAYLCRNDGLLVLAVIGVALVARLVAVRKVRADAVRVVKAGVAFGAGAALLLVPFVAVNEAQMGRPVPPTSELAFLPYYERLFSVHAIGAGFGTGAGRHRQYDVIRSAFTTQPHQVLNAFTPFAFVVLLFLAGALVVSRRRRTGLMQFGWSLPVAAFAAFFLFDAVVLPVAAGGGGFNRSITAYVPLVVIAGVEGLTRWQPRRLVQVAAVVLLAFQPALAVGGPARQRVADANTIGSSLTALTGRVRASTQPGVQPVVMTRAPWETTEATGFPSVQVPDDDICTVVAIARRYHVTHLVVPDAKLRPQLADPAVLAAYGFEPAGGSLWLATGAHC